MNDKEKDNLLLAANNFKCICISINLLTDILKDPVLSKSINFKIPEYDTTSIKIGYWGELFSAKLFATKSILVEKGYGIRVSSREDTSLSAHNDTNWSPIFELEKFNQLAKLKAFW